MDAIRIVAADERDTPIIVEMIRALAEYEKLSHLVCATEERIRTTLFGPSRGPRSCSATADRSVRASRYSFSELFHVPRATGHLFGGPLREASSVRQGSRPGALAHLASLAKERHRGRLEWEVLDWNQ